MEPTPVDRGNGRLGEVKQIIVSTQPQPRSLGVILEPRRGKRAKPHSVLASASAEFFVASKLLQGLYSKTKITEANCFIVAL